MLFLEGILNKVFFYKLVLVLILINIFSVDLKYGIGSKFIKNVDYFILSRGDYWLELYCKNL